MYVKGFLGVVLMRKARFFSLICFLFHSNRMLGSIFIVNFTSLFFSTKKMSYHDFFCLLLFFTQLFLTIFTLEFDNF